MFESKQSDYWFIESTNDLLVCTVTSVSADGLKPCKGDLISIFPLIHKIDRKTNKKDFLYPPSSAVSSISADMSLTLSALSTEKFFYSTVAQTSADIEIGEITKPIITFNNKTDLYNISFLGKYNDNNVSIFTYNFKYLDNQMELLGAHAIVPEEKNYTYKYTFEDGYLHPDYVIKGNDTTGFDSSFGIYFGIQQDEVPPNYQFKPFHFENYLKFAASPYATTVTEVTGNATLPLTWAGGFITQKRSAPALNTEEIIRIDLTCKSYSLTNQDLLNHDIYNDSTPYYRKVNTGSSPGPGSGFCIFLYEPTSETVDVGIGTTSVEIQGLSSFEVLEDPDIKELSLNGYGPSMGYAPASATKLEPSGLIYRLAGIKAKGFVGICFDIEGSFGDSSYGLPPSYDGSTLTQVASSIAIRGGFENDYKLLDKTATLNPATFKMHDDVATRADAPDKDIRIEISNRGTKLKIFGKENSNTYSLLHEVNLANYFQSIPKFLKAGLSFNTSEKSSNFELKKFKVSGTNTQTPFQPKIITSNNNQSFIESQYGLETTGSVNVGGTSETENTCTCDICNTTTSYSCCEC